MRSKKVFFFISFIAISISLILLLSYMQGYVDFNKIFPTKSYTIFTNCNNHMKHNVCAIMTTNATLSKEIKQIYLPNIGPINADIYRDLLSSGFQMCQIIHESCETDLKSEVCQIGQVLYSKK